MSKLFRAATHPEIGAQVNAFCLASREDAEEYLGEGGLGGSQLWAIAAPDENTVLDLGDSPAESIEALYQVLIALGADRDSLGDICCSCQWAYQILWSNGDYWELLAEKYGWVRFPDEYPEGCITTAYLGRKALTMTKA